MAFIQYNKSSLDLYPLFSQVEHPGPAGGAAESLCGAGLPAQFDGGQPAPHWSHGPGSAPASGATGTTAADVQTTPAAAQWYDTNTTQNFRIYELELNESSPVNNSCGHKC